MTVQSDPMGPAPAQPDASAADLVTRLATQTSRLVRDEIRLARAELKESARRSVAAGVFLGTGALVGLLGATAIVAAAIAALTLVIPVWAAALIVGAVLVGAAGFSALIGVPQVRGAAAAPRATATRIRQDMRVLEDATDGRR